MMTIQCSPEFANKYRNKKEIMIDSIRYRIVKITVLRETAFMVLNRTHDIGAPKTITNCCKEEN